MSSKKKSNFTKLGQASAVLASLTLPTIIGGITADASPTRRPSVTTSTSTSPTTRPRSHSTGSITTQSPSPLSRPRSKSLPSGVGNKSPKTQYNPEVSIWDIVGPYLPKEGNEDLASSPIRFNQNTLKEVVKNNIGEPTNRPEVQKLLEQYFGFDE